MPACHRLSASLKGRFHHVKNEVQYHLVCFLDTFRFVTTDDDLVIREAGKLAAVTSEQAHDDHALLLRSLQGIQQVCSASARAEKHENVPGFPEALNLAAEHCIETEIIPDAGERGAVGRERHRRQRTPVGAETTHEFLGHVQCVGCAATVPGKQDLPAAFQCGHDGIRRGSNGASLSPQS